MILERAEFTVVDPEGFAAAYRAARRHIARAPGFRFVELSRGVERPDVFLLLVGWDTVEDHTVGFRGSELYEHWRELLHPFFTAPARVEHFEKGDGPWPSHES
ncbi:antibiotic biosynthesis monooxygenase [Microbispora sp. NPDC046933]|uniref:antibiotic biosynthesis monooxygenase family protein n=1 Tax=Microbispora sp. NPDC046933 TaxID=3155618 RepID=UPI0033C118A0